MKVVIHLWTLLLLNTFVFLQVVHINMAFFILFYINLEAQFFLIIAYLEVKAIKLVQLGTLI